VSVLLWRHNFATVPAFPHSNRVTTKLCQRVWEAHLIWSNQQEKRSVGLLAAVSVLAGGSALAQRPSQHAVLDLPLAPSAVVRPLVLSGPVQESQVKSAGTRLTLDDAIQLGLKSNAELIIRSQQERYVRGQLLTVANSLLPNLIASAYTQTQEINLAAMGFKPNSFHPPGFKGNIPQIVKVDTTEAQLGLTQQLTVPAYFLFRAAQKAGEAATWATLSARGSVVLGVSGLYLRTLADEAQARNAQALVRLDELVYEHAKASKEAGVGINLDVLRAQVQLQNEQQELVRSLNTAAKDKIQLNREMGQPAGERYELVDAVPFAELDPVDLNATMKTAEVKRKDLRGLEAQLEVAEKAMQAVRYERLPTLGLGGFYGVLGETRGLYHGVFAAQGRITIPVFQEATLRGQREVAAAQIIALRQQIAARRTQIEGEIRASMLDVASARAVVAVARSSEQLAGEALQDATLRFTSGVDDNLPVVQAQAALQGAQANVVNAEFQYNYAKLLLARNTGVVESEYRSYLGR